MNEKLRVWVNSEKTPYWKMRLDGYRILKNHKIYQFKKSWWKFGKWEVLYENTKNMEIYVLDEGIIK